ncbi:MAG TPA: ABC transporter permease [Verrucomicrobiae bacterium]|nr:ABC transporter permease [Verrucomicrobiae bacterium]
MWKDLRFSVRALRRNPMVTVVAVASLALGIGANTAIFSLLEQIVLRSLPVADPERLVVLYTDYAASGSASSDTDVPVSSYPLYRDLRDSDRAFSGLIARASAGTRLTWHNATEGAKAEIVSGNFFQVLGVRAAAGRLLEPVDDGAPGASPAVVLRYGYWQTRFAASPEILNDTVKVNGYPMRVVGVTAPQFNGLLQGQLPDIYLPISTQRMAIPTRDLLEQRDDLWLVLFGRLAPGISPGRAQSMTDAAYRSILETELKSSKAKPSNGDEQHFLAGRAELRPASQGISELREKWEKPLDVLMVMVGLVLLIACANVAGLLTARAAARRREISIRLALGAGRAALVKQLLVEGVLLSLVGAAAGLLVENWCTEGLVSLLPRQAGGAWIMPGMNSGLLIFSMALAVLCGIVFSMVPALQATRPAAFSSLNERSSQMTTAQARLRRLLVTSQVALATLLVTAAGLFTLSLVNLLRVDLGFRPERLVSFNLNAPLVRPQTADATALYDDLLSRLRSVGRFTGVAAAVGGPFSGDASSRNITVEGYQPQEKERTDTGVVKVSAGYFQTMRIPLLAGREFNEHDTAAAPKSVVVNQQFVKRFFGERNPLGRHMMFGASDHAKPDREIVGVVADSRTGVTDKPVVTVYMPYSQWDRAEGMMFYVRTAGDENRAAMDLAQVVREADAGLPAPKVMALGTRILESLYTERLIALLAGSFGVLAALLAAIGLYGTMANAVTRRTAEIGLRMALGANPGDVRRMVLWEAARMVAIGLAIGVAGAVALGRVVESQLYQVPGIDPAVLAGAVVMLAAIAFLAAAIPGWRAARIDPLEALRYE